MFDISVQLLQEDLLFSLLKIKSEEMGELLAEKARVAEEEAALLGKKASDAEEEIKRLRLCVSKVPEQF